MLDDNVHTNSNSDNDKLNVTSGTIDVNSDNVEVNSGSIDDGDVDELMSDENDPDVSIVLFGAITTRFYRN